MSTEAAMISAIGGVAGSVLGKSSSPKVDYRGAKKGIRWRARDARLAGIHPLYAMGAPGVGSGILSGGNPGNPSLGAAMADMGQAVGSYMTRPTKAEIDHNKYIAEANQNINLARNQTELDRAQQELTLGQLQISAMMRDAQNANAAPDIPKPPELYTKFWDNQAGRYVYLVNERAGLEPNELIGSGYWARGRLLSPDNAVPQP